MDSNTNNRKLTRDEKIERIKHAFISDAASSFKTKEKRFPFVEWNTQNQGDDYNERDLRTFEEDSPYWAHVPVDEEGEPSEFPRSNPDGLMDTYELDLQERENWIQQLEEVKDVMSRQLSDKEYHAMELTMQGFSYDKIAHNMGISIRTVRIHIDRARRKLCKHFPDI